MRLIDADALKEEVNKKEVVGRFNMLSLIDNVPTVYFDWEKSDAYLDCIKRIMALEKERRELVQFLGKQIQQPTGEWISHYDYCAKHGVIPSALIAFWWCAQCEQAVEQPTNFCPNCGAKMKMKGGEKNE